MPITGKKERAIDKSENIKRKRGKEKERMEKRGCGVGQFRMALLYRPPVYMR
jgi:hypothetical protein